MKISKDLSAGVLHPRENIFLSGTLGSLNAELVIPSDGCASVVIDLRGTFSLGAEVAGTVDGTNWIPIPVRPINTALVSYVAVVTGTAAGVWAGSCVGYRSVRVRATTYTSGAATTSIVASNAPLDLSLQGGISSNTGTNTGASGAAVTLTLAAPGAGLRHYLTYLSIVRFAAAVLTPAAAPVLVTTTNIPTALVFSLPADAATQGSSFTIREDFAYPIATTAQNTATTIVAPITTGVIWRITAGFYVAP